MELAAGLKLAGFTLDVGSMIRSQLKSSKGHKKRILIELQDNIDLVNLWRRSGLPIDKVILKLERAHYDAAVVKDFSLNSVNRRPLKKATTKGVPQFKRYIGWSTEQLLENVYRKMKMLKNVVEMEPNAKNINKEARLGNIYKLMILIVHHINS